MSAELSEEQPDPKPNDGSILIKQSPPVPQEKLPAPWDDLEAQYLTDPEIREATIFPQENE